MLLRYRYFQPFGGRFHYDSDSGDRPAFTLAYSGSIPAGENESTDDVLERLWLRHTTELRPQAREIRPLGTGDVFDLGERGVWQAVALGFRAVEPGELRVEVAA